MANPTVYQGAADPESFTVRVTEGVEPWDMTTVASAYLLVRPPDGRGPYRWTLTIIEQQETYIRFRHTFTEGEVDLPGSYNCMVVMTTDSGGIRRGEPRVLSVLPF